MDAVRRLIDRRHAVRYGVPDHAIGYARVRPGHATDVLDVSAGGALVEVAHRLLPGSFVDLQFERHAERAVLRGRVVRCLVAAIGADFVRYRGAVRFDRPLHWFPADDGDARQRGERP